MSSVADNRYHNELVLETLEAGDAIEFNMGLYSHWGLYKGGGKVIHLTGAGGDRLQSDSGHVFTICGKQYGKACVRIDDFLYVAGNYKANKNNNKDSELSPKSVDEIIETAMSKIGEIQYNVLWCNCEHFVNYCRYGVMKSEQAENALLSVAVAAIVAIGGAVWALFFKKRKKPKRDDD